MPKIKISFIGVGFFSQISHIINYYNNPQVELFEICDLDQEMARGVKKKFNFTGKVYKDYKKMNLKEADGFVIVVQRKIISNIANFFLKNKCNIFTEKPHAYNLKEFKRNKSLQKKIWLKGYVRRSDKAVKELKNNFSNYTKKFGDLICVNYDAKSGNSYLGKKHAVNPKIKKKLISKFSVSPYFLKKKYSKFYDINLNAACHALDLFDFFRINKHEKFSSIISDKIFSANFLSKFQNKNVVSRINLSASKVNFWDEKMEFLFEKGQIKITFSPPLYKKNSYKVEIKNGSNVKKISYKNKWSFNQQSKNFVKLIKEKGYRNHDSSDGYESINLYENIWKDFQKNNN